MPFNGAQAGADALGAIREAINMFMELRSEKAERERRDLAESRAGKALALQEEQHNLEQQQVQFQEDERQRKQLEFMFQNFGGQRADQPTVQRGQRLGYGAGFEPEMTLPGRSLAMSTAPAGGEGPVMPGGAMPTQATGEMLFKMPESEKSRIAYYNAAARASENQLTRDQRDRIETQRNATRLAQIRSAMNNTAMMAAAMRYGTDVRDATQRMALENTILRNTAAMDDAAFDNLFNGGNILNILRFATPQGLQLPQPPQPPNYYAPRPGDANSWSVEPSR